MVLEDWLLWSVPSELWLDTMDYTLVMDGVDPDNIHLLLNSRIKCLERQRLDSAHKDKLKSKAYQTLKIYINSLVDFHLLIGNIENTCLKNV